MLSMQQQNLPCRQRGAVSPGVKNKAGRHLMPGDARFHYDVSSPLFLHSRATLILPGLGHAKD